METKEAVYLNFPCLLHLKDPHCADLQGLAGNELAKKLAVATLQDYK